MHGDHRRDHAHDDLPLCKAMSVGEDARAGSPCPRASLGPASNFPARATLQGVGYAKIARAVTDKEEVRSGAGLQRPAFTVGLQLQETPDFGKPALGASAKLIDDPRGICRIVQDMS